MTNEMNNDATMVWQAQPTFYGDELGFQKLANSSPDAILIFDVPQFKPIYFNHPGLLGYSNPELLGMDSLAHLIHPADWPQVKEVWDRTLEGQDGLCEFRMESKSGQWEWLQGRSTVFLRAATGSVRQLLLTFSLITARKQAEQFYRHEADFSQAILDTAGSLVLVTDRQGRIVRFNRACEQKTGYRFSEVRGQALWDLFINPDEKAGVINAYDRLTPDRFPFQYENYWLTREGERCFISWSATALMDEAGQPEYIIATGIDITQHQQLAQLKEEFVAAISHELRTPLTAMMGALGLVLGGAVGPVEGEVEAMTRLAHQNGERLLRLVNDILDVSQLEAGKLPMNVEKLSLIQLVAQALENNRAYAEQFGVEFRLGHTLPDSFNIRADAQRVLQVLNQLLTNAAKFSPASSQVLVSVVQAGSALRVEVRDRGPGIPLDFAPKVFEKFSQAHNSTNRQTGGAGLGLNISKTIIERLGGQIGFENNSTQAGATFYFELPHWQE